MNKNSLPALTPLLAVALTVALTACSLPNRPVTQAAAAVSKPYSSGEILQVLRTLNNGEIKQAELALQRSVNPLVQRTAKVIIRDHAASNMRIANLAQAGGFQLEGSALSKGLQVQANEIAENLASLSGTQFDCTYLQKQVELHALALDTARKQLLPGAENPQVRMLLQAAAPVLEQHRDIAQGHRQALAQCPRG